MKTLLCIFIVNYLILHVCSQESIRYYVRGQGVFKEIPVTETDDLVSDNSTVFRAQSESLDGGSRRQGSCGRKKLKLSTPEECARTCRVGARPKNCYYHFHVELYRTLGGACNLCQPTTNTSLSSDCQCIKADGFDMSGIMTVNRQYPGPSIQVCLGDLVIVDVANHAVGAGITIHWHGIYQKDYQYYDGVPSVTQCPITHGTTFRYQFRAQNAGTHFWHAHTGLHKPDGLEGAIIIRPPKSLDPNKHHYDQDNFDNIIFLSDWFHESASNHWPGTSTRNVGQIPANVLINGRGRWFDPETNKTTNVPLAVFNVEPKKRIRFRMINSLSWTCPVELTIQNHTLTIIGTDGEDVKPKNVTTLNTFSAERIDFILTANQPIGTYWIQARLTSICTPMNISQVAIVKYIGSNLEEPALEKPVYEPGLPRGIVFNPLNDVCNNNSSVICVKDLENADPINEDVITGEPDVSVFLPVGLFNFTDEELYGSDEFYHFEIPSGGNGFMATLSNISNTFRGSPYISQIDDIPADAFCNGDRKPKKCTPGKPCLCSHIIDIPLNAVVELVVIDTLNIELAHPFHLHGSGFYVLAQGLLTDVNINQMNYKQALGRHEQFYGARNRRPPVKDTLATPSAGYTIVRFLADNPGYWLYHCHFMTHLLTGMDLVFHVGSSDNLPPIPEGFPKCGTFQPDILRN